MESSDESEMEVSAESVGDSDVIEVQLDSAVRQCTWWTQQTFR